MIVMMMTMRIRMMMMMKTMFIEALNFYQNKLNIIKVKNFTIFLNFSSKMSSDYMSGYIFRQIEWGTGSFSNKRSSTHAFVLWWERQTVILITTYIIYKHIYKQKTFANFQKCKTVIFLTLFFWRFCPHWDCSSCVSLRTAVPSQLSGSLWKGGAWWVGGWGPTTLFP